MVAAVAIGKAMGIENFGDDHPTNAERIDAQEKTLKNRKDSESKGR